MDRNPQARGQDVLVLGDSHVRAFSGSATFLPIFLGPGKENCFIDDGTLHNLKQKVTDVLDRVRRMRILLVLGEPDTRFYLGLGWYPWEEKRKSNASGEVTSHMRRGITASAERYCVLLDHAVSRGENEVSVLSISPTERMTQNRLAEMFNAKLRVACQDRGVRFVDIYSLLVTPTGELDTTFRLDQVHLNTNIQQLVVDKLAGCNGQREVADATAVLKICEYAPAHGCYALSKNYRNDVPIAERWLRFEDG